jgi:hypothetical protein
MKTVPFLEDAAGKDNVAVALFGKHPAAADHLEDIGLNTASLTAFKQMLYVEGIGECLSRLAWAKDLTSPDSIPYDHQLLTIGPGGWLAARLVASTDAAGRKQFPLVLAAHGTDFSTLHHISELGQMLHAQIAATITATDISALRQAQAEALKLALSITAGTAPTPGPAARESWLQHLPLGDQREGFWRCCHALLPTGAAAGRARVPIHHGSPWASAALWASFLRRLCPQAALMITLNWKLGQAFADVSLMPPVARTLGSMFAPETSQPMTSSIPFNISAEVRAEAQSTLVAWLSASEMFPTDPAAKNPSSGVLNKVCKGMLGWFKP